MPLHYHDAAVRDMVKLSISDEIIADRGPFWYPDVLIQDCAPNFCVAANIAIIENDRVLD